MNNSRRKLTRLMAVAWAVLAFGAVMAPTSASAATCGTARASVSELGGYSYRWSGSAVGMCSSWKYSWHIELLMQHNGDCDSHDKTNFGSTTYTSTPTYTNYCDPITYGGYGCVHFRLHHGTSNSSPLVDEGIACSSGAPARAMTQPGLLAPGESGARETATVTSDPGD